MTRAQSKALRALKIATPVAKHTARVVKDVAVTTIKNTKKVGNWAALKSCERLAKANGMKMVKKSKSGSRSPVRRVSKPSQK